MKHPRRLRVIDAAPANRGGQKGRKLPFKTGQVFTEVSRRGEGPAAIVELKELDGYFAACRFEPVED